MFASKTTIEGWRLTVTTLLDLIHELFDNGYPMVFNRKLNRDPIEVSSLRIVSFVLTTINFFFSKNIREHLDKCAT